MVKKLELDQNISNIIHQFFDGNLLKNYIYIYIIK